MKREWLQYVGGGILLLAGLWSIQVHNWATMAVDSYFGLHPLAARGLWELPLASQIYTLVIAAQGHEPAKWLMVPIISQVVLLPSALILNDKLRRASLSK